jgi:exoribonuclease II
MLYRCSCSSFFIRGSASRLYSTSASKTGTVVDVLEPLESFTRRLIDSSAAGDANHKHRDGIKLWSTIPQATRQADAVPSMEKARFVREETQADIEPVHGETLYEGFPPGTFVEIRRWIYTAISINNLPTHPRNQVVTFGVILQLQILEGRQHAMTLTYTGEIWPHLTTDITYSIPNFISQDLIYRSGASYEAANIAETVTRLKVVEQIRTFARRHERHFLSMGKDITVLYEAVRHPDSERWTDITTPEATRHLDVRKPPPILTLFAVHTHMMSRPLYFVADPRNHKTTHRFSVRPLSHVQTIIQVNDWVRSFDPALQSFLEKARRVITETRRIRKKFPQGPPTQVQTSFEPWSSTDLVFIRYLQHSLRTTRTTQDDPYETALPNIAKRLGLYTKEIVSPGLTHTMLCELGILAPWDDVVLRTPELHLDLSPPSQSKEVQTLTELVTDNMRSPGTPVSSSMKKKLVDVHLDGSTELHASDPYESVRHDYGNLPVYVVDDLGAHELDDGLSIEPVPNEQGSYWVHIHVADPTTVIPPGHVFDLRARTSASTLYSAHRTWPMLPPTLTQSLFSLGSSAKEASQSVLTFSVKLNEDGDFLDYKVRAGIVRNFRILQYDQVDRVLGIQPIARTYPLGGTRLPESPVDPVAPGHRSDLQKLFELADKFSIRTAKENPIIFFTFPSAKIDVQSALPSNPILPHEPILWKGYPSMIFYVEQSHETSSTTRRVVSEFMKLACRAASRFCLDRGLPALRRVSAPLQAQNDKDMADILAMRNALGYVDPIECLKRNLYTPPGEPTIEPLQHWSLGIPKGEGYCRVTSPLRRYGDLMMHWQIKHELLPVSKRTTEGPLFPAEYMKPVMFRLFDKEKAVHYASLLYEKHWALSCISRHIEKCRLKHGPDFNCFPDLMAQTTTICGFDTRNATGQVPVMLHSLGVRGLLRGIDAKKPLPIGTVLPVKITDVFLGLAPLIILAPR